MNKNKSIPYKSRASYILKCSEIDRFIVYEPPFSIKEIYKSLVISEYALGYAAGKLLELFVSNPNEVIDRDRIFQISWPDRIVAQNSLNQVIYSIRQLMGDESVRKAIQTIPRRGYIFDSAFILNEDEGDAIVKLAKLKTDKDSQTQLNCNNIVHDKILSPKKLPPEKYKISIIRVVPFLLFFILSISLIVRAYYILIGDWAYVSSTIKFDHQKVTYIAPNNHEVEDLKKTVEPTRERLKSLSENSSHILFNKMHDFYNIVCLSEGSAPKFITVNFKKITELTEYQLIACIK